MMRQWGEIEELGEGLGINQIGDGPMNYYTYQETKMTSEQGKPSLLIFGFLAIW